MARKDGKAENQHYVPKMLLRNFAFPTKGKEEQVYVFDKHNEGDFPTAISNIAAERGFYEADFGDGLVSLETSLSVLEDKTRAAFAKLIEHEDLNALSDEDRAWIAIFVASQRIRVRHFRETVKAMNEQLLEKLRRMGHDPVEVEGVPVLTDDEELKRFAIQFLVESMKEFSQHLTTKAWLLMRTTPERPFWISDNPVTMHNSKDFGPYGNIGLAVRGIQIHLPLSSTLTLALWCPFLVEEFYRNYEDGKKSREQLRAQRVLGLNPDISKIDQLVQRYDESIAKLGDFIAGMESGKPTECNEENVTFFNSLQVQWSHRFVMSPIREFGLAKKMLKEHPHYRKGIQPKVS